MKEQFHSLRMDESTKVFDHLSVLTGIIYELETIGVKIDDEYTPLRLIWSLPSFYGNETSSFEEVACKIISKERRFKGEGNTLLNSMLAARGRSYVKKKMKQV